MKRNIVIIYDQFKRAINDKNFLSRNIDILLKNLYVVDIEILGKYDVDIENNYFSSYLCNIGEDDYGKYINKIVKKYLDMFDDFNLIMMSSDVNLYDDVSFIKYISEYLGKTSNIYVAAPILFYEKGLWDKFFVIINSYVFKKNGLFYERSNNMDFIMYEFSNRFYEHFSADNVFSSKEFPLYYPGNIFSGYTEYGKLLLSNKDINTKEKVNEKEGKLDISNFDLADNDYNNNDNLLVDDNVSIKDKIEQDIILKLKGNGINIDRCKFISSDEDLVLGNDEKYLFILNSDIYLKNKDLLNNYDIVFLDYNYDLIDEMRFDYDGNPMFYIFLKKKDIEKKVVFFYIDDYYKLSVMLTNLINQTLLPDKIIILDNVLNRYDIRENEIYKYHFNVISSKGIYYEYLWIDQNLGLSEKRNVIGNIINSRTNDFDYVFVIKFSSLVTDNNWIENIVNVLKYDDSKIINDLNDKNYIFYVKNNNIEVSDIFSYINI